VGWLSQVQHWWLWFAAALVSGIVGALTGSPISLYIALGALAAGLVSVAFPGFVEWMAFLFVTCGMWMFSSTLVRKRRRAVVANPGDDKSGDSTPSERAREGNHCPHDDSP